MNTIEEISRAATYRSVSLDLYYQGIYTIPIDSDRQSCPIEYDSLPSEYNVVGKFTSQYPFIGIATGKLSNGVQCIAIELSSNLWKEFNELVKKLLPQIYTNIVIEQTPSLGYHLFFKCDITGRSRALAARAATNTEKIANPDILDKELIYLHSNLSNVIISPSLQYVTLYGSFDAIKRITPADYELLMACCTHFDRMGGAIRFQNYLADKHTIYKALYGDIDWSRYDVMPWEDYSKRGNILMLLRDNGWLCIDEETLVDGRMVMRLCKTQGQKVAKATYGIIDHKLTVEDEGTLFQKDLAMHPFEVFMLMNSYGNAMLAIQELIARGFGVLQGQSVTAMIPETIPRPFFTTQHRKEKLDEEQFTTIKTFWKIVPKSKNEIKIEIDDKNYLLWLSSWGLFLYNKSPDKTNPFVVVKNNIIEEVSMKYIKDATMEYIRSLPQEFDGINKDDLENVMLKSSFRIFDSRYMDFLPIFNSPQLKDSISNSYIPFKNGVLRVDMAGMTLLSYDEMPYAVWRSHIINHEFQPNVNAGINAVFGDFISRISGNDQLQFDASVSVVGYLLHTYKDKSKPFAVTFTDQRGSFTPEGGTGKGILVQGIEQIRRVVTLDGKKKGVTTKDFALQRVRPDTSIIALQDIDKDFNFEQIFNWVTEGLTVEGKYGLEKYVSYEDSPKFIINTNYSMRGDSGSHRRRKVSIELFPYFSYAFTPMHQYGKRFFQGWDHDEWNRFYNFMALCIYYYMVNGIIIAPGFASRNKKFYNDTSPEFMQWWLTAITNPAEQKIFITQEYVVSVLYAEFNRTTQHKIDIATFDQWIKKGVTFSKLLIASKMVEQEEVYVISQNNRETKAVKDVLPNIRKTPIVKLIFKK